LEFDANIWLRYRRARGAWKWKLHWNKLEKGLGGSVLRWGRGIEPGSFRCVDPTTNQVCVDAIGQSDRSARHAGLLAGLDKFGLELRGMPAPPAPGGSFDQGSIHLST
jgi:hypothetical protein